MLDCAVEAMLCSGGVTQRYQSKNCYSDLTVSPPRDKSEPHCGPGSDAPANGRCYKSGSGRLEAVTQLPKNATNDSRERRIAAELKLSKGVVQ